MNVDKNKIPLFGNLSRFRNKLVTVVLNNGAKINGVCKSYDDASNLILENNGKRFLCLGRCLSLISLGEGAIL